MKIKALLLSMISFISGCSSSSSAESIDWKDSLQYERIEAGSDIYHRVKKAVDPGRRSDFMVSYRLGNLAFATVVDPAPMGRDNSARVKRYAVLWDEKGAQKRVLPDALLYDRFVELLKPSLGVLDDDVKLQTLLMLGLGTAGHLSQEMIDSTEEIVQNKALRALVFPPKFHLSEGGDSSISVEYCDTTNEGVQRAQYQQCTLQCVPGKPLLSCRRIEDDGESEGAMNEI